MITKIKYLGSGEENLTINNIYVVLGFMENSSHFRAIIVNDNGHLYQTEQNVDDTSKWELVSVEYTGSVAVFSV